MKPSGFFANVTGLIGRTRSVYDRFFVANLKRSRGPFRLRGQDGSAQGCIETITYSRGQIGVKGWCLAPGISIRLGATEVRSTPSLERNDVADALGCDPRVGFMLDIPLDEGPIEFETISDTLSQQVQLKTKPPVPRRRDRVRLFAQFMVQVSLSLPDIARYFRRGDETSLRHIKRCLGLVDDASANGMKMQLSAFNAPDAADGEAQQNDSVTIILPVFNAFSLLPSVLERVIYKTEIPFHLIIMEDQSTDERVRPFLKEWTARQTHASHRVTLVEAQENRGFVRSVNAGLEIAEQEPNAPVVLLNSDALVPSGWATRLLAPMRDDPTIASVTPLSNDAEILTIPAIGSTIDLGGAEVDAVDDTLRSAMDPKWGQKLDLPTGVGFCMAMNPAFLKQVPRLDTEFGRGYGEEVDWCQKTRQLGGRHVAACNLFVGHCGGQSFGTQKKRKLVSENNAIVSRRYPKYDAEVAAFAATDPLTTPRMIGTFALLRHMAQQSEVPVYMAHSLGGGAENWLTSQIKKLHPRAAVVIRVGGTNRFLVEATIGDVQVKAPCDDPAFLVRLCGLLPRRRIVYSCAVGDWDPVSIPGILRDLSDGGALDILFHDYFPISPSYTLLDADHVHRGVPTPNTPDLMHTARTPDGKTVSLATWQQNWGQTLDVATKIVTFSNASRALVAQAYPSVAHRITVQPHVLETVPARVLAPRRNSNDGLTIGVLGNIGPQKGSAVVCSLVDMVKRGTQGRVSKVVVLGRLDRVSAFDWPSVVHGPYEIQNIPALIDRYDIDLWLIPSIWPETFSYATHECLATGLPVYTFDLGAQAEAVSVAPNGHVIELPKHTVPIKDVASSVLHAVSGPQHQTPRIPETAAAASLR